MGSVKVLPHLRSQFFSLQVGVLLQHLECFVAGDGGQFKNGEIILFAQAAHGFMPQIVPGEVLNFGALAGIAENTQKASPVDREGPIRWVVLACGLWLWQCIQHLNRFPD